MSKALSKAWQKLKDGTVMASNS